MGEFEWPSKEKLLPETVMLPPPGFEKIKAKSHDDPVDANLYAMDFHLRRLQRERRRELVRVAAIGLVLGAAFWVLWGWL